MKKVIFSESILSQPISELKLSKEFKNVTKKYGYQTLADMLRIDTPYSLLKHACFDYRMLAEFVNFLEKHQLGYYLN